jgi:hypothetical protein
LPIVSALAYIAGIVSDDENKFDNIGLRSSTLTGQSFTRKQKLVTSNLKELSLFDLGRRGRPGCAGRSGRFKS